MTQISGTLRGPKKGLSTLGGAVRVYAFSADQFTADTNWPLRSDISSGEVDELPLITDETAARLIFDFDSQGHGKSAGTTTATQFSYQHSLSGRVAGITAESDATLDEMAGLDLILVTERPNGERRVYGSTFKPMRMKVDDDWGGKADDYVGSTIEFTQVDAVDFRPPILATSVTLTANTLPAYS